MSDRYPGGIITKTPVTPAGPYAEGSAPGVWTLEQQAYWQAQGLWPNASNPTPNDPYFQYVTSLLHGDGTNGGQNNTFLDSSTNAFTITRNGNTTQGSFSPYGSNWGTYFAGGSGYYITSPANSAFEFTADFTFECWYNFAGFSSVHSLFTIANGSTYCLNVDITNQQYSFIINGTDYRFNTKFTDGVWEHVAVVRSGSTITVYKNGIAIGTATNSSTWGNTTQAFWISDNAYKGYISNLRLVASAVYTSNFTPSTTPLTAIANTRLLCMQNNRYIDNSGNNLTLTPGNSSGVSVTRFSPFAPTYATQYSASTIGGSGYFDGTGDYLSIANNAAFQFGTGDFTVEFWFYNTGTLKGFIAMNGTSGGSWAAVFAGGALYWQPDTATSNLYSNSSSSLVANAWNHVAIVRASGTNKMYFNGIVQATTAADSTNYASTAALYIGLWPGSIGGGSNDYFTGYLSNVRINKGTAVYTGSFTPPSLAPLATSGASSAACYPSTTNVNTSFAASTTSLLTSMTNGAIYDNAEVADYETVGNAQISTSVKKYGTGSLAFDGTGDYLLTNAPDSEFAFGTGNFTIEMWVYFNVLGAIAVVYDGRPASTDSTQVCLFKDASNYMTLQVNGSYQIVSGIALVASTWYHVAVSRAGTSTKMFINGTQTGSTYSDSTNYTGGVGRPVIGASGYTLGSLPMNGYIDDLRVTKGYARYWENFTPPAAALPNFGGAYQVPTQDPQFNYTTLLLPGNGTNGAQNNNFLDSSTNAFTITRNGNTTQGTFTPFSQTGWGNYFSGATNASYLGIATNSAFNFGTGAWTLEFWVYLNSYPSANYGGVFEWGNDANRRLRIDINTSGQLMIPIAGQWAVNTCPTAMQLGQWYHVALSCNGSGTTNVYLNGTLERSLTSGTINDGGIGTRIGGDAYQTATFDRYISNVRVVNSQLYTANFTPPTTALTAVSGTQLLTCQANRFVDKSANALSLTPNGTYSVQAFSPFAPTAAYSASTVGGSGYFDGSGDYLDTTSSISTGTGDYTWEGWVYYSGSGIRTVFSHGDVANSTGFEFYTDGNYFYIYNSSITPSWPSSIPIKQQWIHFALVRSSGSFKLYVNGVLQTATGTTSSTTNYSGTFRTGSELFSGGTGAEWIGYISNLRLNNTAVYTSNFTPSTTPLAAISGTQLLLNFTNAGITDATAKNDLETVGNAQISTTQSKFGGSSMYFDGTGDALYTDNSNLYSFGTGDFTIECWINTTQSTNGGIIAKRTASGATNTDWGLWVNLVKTNGVSFYASNGSSYFVAALGGGNVTDGNWHHVAVTRYGSSFMVFVDGALVDSSTASDAIASSTKPLWVGNEHSGGVGFNGYIQDLRVTKGYARYVQPFTPPAQADQLY